jgi:hypothetical protein
MNATCGECGKSAVEGWALYCVSCCEDSMVKAAVAEEREACAKVTESYEPICDRCPSGVANAIRARGDK